MNIRTQKVAAQRHRPGKVHVVMANHDCSGASPVRVFDDVKDADSFAEKCRLHDAKQPVCPDFDDSPENEERWIQWQGKHARWVKRHPAAAHIGCDSWSVCSVPFVQAANQSQRSTPQ